jgi:hypothetical protein
MRNFYLFLISVFILGSSCNKEDLSPDSATIIPPPPKPKEPNPSPPTATTIYNPIVGKWELGMFKMVCFGSTDTIIYPNERGDFIEFRKNDTAFYTYNTTNATGWSPYKILDSTRFILGDTMRIISYDGIRLTTYTKSSNGSAQQWMTYKKATN